MILFRIIDSQVQFDCVAAHPLDRLSCFDQRRVCGELVQPAESLRSDSHVVFVHLRVGESATQSQTRYRQQKYC